MAIEQTLMYTDMMFLENVLPGIKCHPQLKDLRVINLAPATIPPTARGVDEPSPEVTTTATTEIPKSTSTFQSSAERFSSTEINIEMPQKHTNKSISMDTSRRARVDVLPVESSSRWTDL